MIMAVLQLLLAMIFRWFGTILNTLIGWASMLLFGKVPENRQYLLSAITFCSVIWLALALGVLLPRVGAFLLTLVVLPRWVDRAYVRMAMLGLALLLPVAVGFASLYLQAAENRPAGNNRWRAIIRGYPCTLGMALTLLMMCCVAPILRARTLLMRWSTTHLPVVVEPPDYLEVVTQIGRVLRSGGYETVRRRATWMVRLPTAMFTFFAGRSVQGLVADQLTVLKSDSFEVELHPSDLVIRGRDRDVMRIHALIAEHVTFTRAYQTWSKEANAVEDRLTALWRELRDSAPELDLASASRKLAAIEELLRTVAVDYREWAVLFREKLIVERGMLRVAAGLTDTLEDATVEPADRRSAPGFHLSRE